MLVACARRRLNHRDRIRGRKRFLQAPFERVVELLPLPIAVLAPFAAAMFGRATYGGVLVSASFSHCDVLVAGFPVRGELAVALTALE